MKMRSMLGDMPDWHVHTMINMWIKYKMYDEPTLYGSRESDLSMKNWCKYNRLWKWGQGQVAHEWWI